ncbi:hypothetical protein DCC85_02185 [Paenibacillus sp. CAA11]|nr:hypothetical protein DCC85_02185 [Paenibacillus sp. CAA11]
MAEEEASKNMLEKSWDSFKEIGSDHHMSCKMNLVLSDEEVWGFYKIGQISATSSSIISLD